MKLLLDQDVYAASARFLSDLGHDIVPVARIGLSQAEDEEILRVAQEQNRILVTRDRDFGNLVFVKALGTGVVYLRILPSTQNAVHGELERVLSIYTKEELTTEFVVVEPMDTESDNFQGSRVLSPLDPSIAISSMILMARSGFELPVAGLVGMGRRSRSSAWPEESAASTFSVEGRHHVLGDTPKDDNGQGTQSFLGAEERSDEESRGRETLRVRC